jgi:hypothetical protein
MGTAIASLDQGLKNVTGLGQAKFSNTQGDMILSMASLQ